MTKTIALTLAALLGSATLASAQDNSFSLDRQLDASSFISLENIRASGDGTVEIYDYHTGVQGDLLGSQKVRAGANANVHSLAQQIARLVQINLGQTVRDDVIAVLKVNGQIVATQEYDVEPR